MIEKRVIMDLARTAPYLVRWSLMLPLGMSLKLHLILRPDDDRCAHDHPWSFFRLILWGGYVEEWPRFPISRQHWRRGSRGGHGPRGESTFAASSFGIAFCRCDPGSYEGGDAKPTDYDDPERMNRWCVRECERCDITAPGSSGIELRDFAKRRPNIPGKVR